MTIYARFEKFNISYNHNLGKFFITSKNEGRPEIGSFEFAAQAIEFATKRVS